MLLYWYLYVYKIGKLNSIGTNLILVIANVLIFTGFAVLPIRKNNVLIETIAEYSLWIYLIHPMFTELLSQVCGRVIKVFPSAIGIPIYAIIITAICIAVWKICVCFWQACRKRNSSR